MPRPFSVDWGSTPDISGSMSSLGASLAGAMNGGGGSKAARDAAYIESLNRHNSVYDKQAAKIAAETAAKQQEMDLANQQNTRAQSAADTAWQSADAKMVPAGIGVLPRLNPAIVQYDADSNAARDHFKYVYGSGDGSPESRAKAVKELYPGPVPVDNKPIFDSKHTRRLVPDSHDPSGYRSVPIGGVPVESATGGQKPSAENLKAAGFVKRLEDANRIMNEEKVAQSSQNVGDRVLDYVPIVGRSLQSNDYKRRADAETDMVTAVLRDESGATISDPEFGRDADKYFPRVNDPPEVIADKARRRQIQIDSMKIKAGPALQSEAAGSVSFDETNPRHKQLRQEAEQAIAEGRDEAAVMQRFNELIASEGSQ